MQSRASDLIKISRIEAEKWLSNGLEIKDAKEIRDLLSVGNENNLIESFHKKLEFGTGGIRGLIGIGSNKINTYTISIATQGLCNYLNKINSDRKSGVIAYDSRRFSKEFGHQTAKIFSANNITDESYIGSRLHSNPGQKEAGLSSGIIIGPRRQINLGLEYNF